MARASRATIDHAGVCDALYKATDYKTFEFLEEHQGSYEYFTRSVGWAIDFDEIDAAVAPYGLQYDNIVRILRKSDAIVFTDEYGEKEHIFPATVLIFIPATAPAPEEGNGDEA